MSENDPQNSDKVTKKAIKKPSSPTKFLPIILGIFSAVYAVSTFVQYIDKLKEITKKQDETTMAMVERHFKALEGDASLMALYNNQAQSGEIQKGQCEIATVISGISSKDIKTGQRYIDVLGKFKKASVAELGVYQGRLAKVVNAVGKSDALVSACRDGSFSGVDAPNEYRIYEWYEKPDIQLNYHQ